MLDREIQNQNFSCLIDCELLYAANKYNFKRLVSECLIHLRQTISDANVIEITKAAYLLDKDDLMLEAMRFLKQNGSEETKKHWNRLLKECPGLNLKTTNLLLFGNDSFWNMNLI